jgi:tetratricopeptide (TPR) repeat protein
MAKSVELFREVGDMRSMLSVMMNLATTQGSSGTMEEAEDHAHQVLATAEREGFAECVPPMLSLLSQLRYKAGRYEEALDLSTKAFEGWSKLGNAHGVGVATNNSAHALRRLGRFEEAADHYLRTLDVRLEINDRQGLLWTFEGVAKLALEMEKREVAIRIAGAVTAMRRRLNIHQLEIDKPEWAATLAAIQDVHGRDEWWSQGELMEEQEVVALVRSELNAITASQREGQLETTI